MNEIHSEVFNETNRVCVLFTIQGTVDIFYRRPQGGIHESEFNISVTEKIEIAPEIAEYFSVHNCCFAPIASAIMDNDNLLKYKQNNIDKYVEIEFLDDFTQIIVLTKEQESSVRVRDANLKQTIEKKLISMYNRNPHKSKQQQQQESGKNDNINDVKQTILV